MTVQSENSILNNKDYNSLSLAELKKYIKPEKTNNKEKL